MGSITSKTPPRRAPPPEVPRDVDAVIWRQARNYQRGIYSTVEPGPAADVTGDPTLEEIAAACEEIQATWGPGERERRRVQQIERLTARVVSVVDLIGAMGAS